MAITLYHVGRTPGQIQYGLDTFTEHYKASEGAGDVLTDTTVPDTQMNAVHPDYPFMFVTARYCSETGESSSSLDVTYTGCIRDDGEGNPALPSPQRESDTQIQSASSSKSSTGGVLTSPATIQFYAPSNVLTYLSYINPGTDLPDDPSGTPSIITFTLGDTAFSISNFFTELLAIFFSLFINTTTSAQEVVAGKFWQNTARKTLTYVPYIFDLPSGPFISLASPGDGYTAGDTLTISEGGENATIVVDSVGGIFGGSGILSFHVTADTFTVDQNLLPASGGTGTGAKFNVMIIP